MGREREEEKERERWRGHTVGRGDTERQKREGREEETAGEKSEEYTCITLYKSGCGCAHVIDSLITCTAELILCQNCN